MFTFPKSERIENNASLPVIAKPTGTMQRQINDAFDASLDSPLRMFATFPAADSKLNFSASQVLNANGSAKSVGPIGTTIPPLPITSIDFQTGLVVGGPVSITFPASTVGKYRRCAFSLDNTGTLIASFSSEETLLASLPNPGTLFTSGALPVGWVDLECTNAAGLFKTAGSLTNVIENSVGGVSRIAMIAAGAGGAGGGSGNTGAAQEVAVPLAATSINIVFPSPLSGTNYVPIAQLVNITDANPQYQSVIVTNKTATGFTAKWNSPTDSSNYRISYIVPVLQEQIGEAPIGVGASSVVVNLPIPYSGNVYSVVAQLVNYVNGSPQFQPVTISAKSATSFTAKWNAATDGADYRLAYHVSQYT